MTALWQAIAETISAATSEPFRITHRESIGGGCINHACRISDGDRTYFVKLNHAGSLEMFEAEFAGLQALREPGALRIPQPVCTGTAGDKAFLVLEYLDLHRPEGNSARALGSGLAALHRTTRERFGWHRDNTIGSTPQPNREESDWVTFWRDHRLGFQLELAARKGAGRGVVRKGEALLERCGALFQDYTPTPSLLHGDLWGGNWSVDRDGNPVLFDPAVYFGDRETDIAMTELFGGFPAPFYRAYNEAWPLDPGYRQRRDLYNLYHILNHFNLFGGGYLSQAEQMIDRLLSRI